MDEKATACSTCLVESDSEHVPPTLVSPIVVVFFSDGSTSLGYLVWDVEELGCC